MWRFEKQKFLPRLFIKTLSTSFGKKFKRLKKDAVPSKKIPVRQHEKPLKGNKLRKM